MQSACFRPCSCLRQATARDCTRFAELRLSKPYDSAGSEDKSQPPSTQTEDATSLKECTHLVQGSSQLIPPPLGVLPHGMHPAAMNCMLSTGEDASLPGAMEHSLVPTCDPRRGGLPRSSSCRQRASCCKPSVDRGTPGSRHKCYTDYFTNHLRQTVQRNSCDSHLCIASACANAAWL